MRKFSEVVRKIKANEAIVEKEKARWLAWLQLVNNTLENNAAYFEDLLLDYMRREREANDRKSIKLPHGTIKSISTQPKIIPLDGFIDWAQANNRDDLLTFSRPKPNITAIKQAGIENEFVEVVPAEVSYLVKVNE